MICEICGREFKGRGVNIIIDGAKLTVCPKCAKFGTRIEVHKEEKKILPKKKKEIKKVVAKKDEFTIVPDYSELIRKAREELKLSQKELASRINEKESVIHRLETGNMTPSYNLARKLEKALKIRIMDKISEVEIPKLTLNSKTLTIGDIIKIKKK